MYADEAHTSMSAIIIFKFCTQRKNIFLLFQGGYCYLFQYNNKWKIWENISDHKWYQ